MTAFTTKDERFAALADALAGAVRAGDLASVDALRVIRHELRQRNKKKALLAPARSKAAQEVIDRYTAESKQIPTNDSPQALHCDHVFALTAEHLQRLDSRAAWLMELPRLDTVVCVTAAENYALEWHERRGADGWAKFALAGVELTGPPGADFGVVSSGD